MTEHRAIEQLERPFRQAHVNLAAITNNVRALRERIQTEHTMAVVKSRAYGHGAVPAARAALAGGADWLGVVSIDEALELRDAGLTAPILAWLHDPFHDFGEAISRSVDIGVSYLAQLDEVANSARRVGMPASVQLKVDTGLGRNGAGDSEWPELFAAAAAYERLGLLSVRGVWSHLSNTGETEDLEQVANFERALDVARDAGLTPQLTHIAASAGALRLPSSRFNLVRLGIVCWGITPFDDETAAELGLTPALELSARIASVKRVAAGSGVSYDYTYRTTRETTLALVPLGYNDGIPRHASNAAAVTINGITYAVAGRIAMDQFVVDVGDNPVAVGDRATLFGDPATGVPSIDVWAKAADTINYEIVTRLGGRIELTYER